MTFKETLELHLEAVRNRDIDTLITTLPKEGEETILILPNGSMDRSRDSFVEGHIEWFSDKSWRQDIEILNIIESKEMGLATVKYDYVVDEKVLSTALLTLVFKLVDNNWVLVHDQNTPIG